MAGHGRTYRRVAVTPHQRLIQAAGGPRDLSRLTGIPETTIATWAHRGRISGRRFSYVCSVLREEGFDPARMMEQDGDGSLPTPRR